LATIAASRSALSDSATSTMRCTPCGRNSPDRCCGIGLIERHARHP
jgi:hypothetical protein